MRRENGGGDGEDGNGDEEELKDILSLPISHARPPIAHSKGRRTR